MSRTKRMLDLNRKTDVARRHWKDNTPVSELAEQLDVQLSQIHQKKFCRVLTVPDQGNLGLTGIFHLNGSVVAFFS